MKNIITQEIATTLDIPARKAQSIVESVLNEVKQGLIKDSIVTLRGFGSFHVFNKKERMGRNPKTGEDAIISARKVPAFKASKKLKAKVNNGDPYV